jgi:hypothetical protein
MYDDYISLSTKRQENLVEMDTLGPFMGSCESDHCKNGELDEIPCRVWSIIEGKPSLHVVQDPGFEFSYGIEVVPNRWMLSLVNLNKVLQQECGALGYKTCSILVIS